MNHFAYDIFLSHNRADKVFVRHLANQLAGINYNGRLLRPWLDEHFLEAGALGSNSELTSALDQSRILCLVLSPEAMSSKWVDFELEYFLQSRTAGSVVVLLRKACTPPPALHNQELIDCRDEDIESAITLLLERVCPVRDVSINDVKRTVTAAFEMMWVEDKGGFSPGPTQERNAFFDALIQYDINDAACEGLALGAFRSAASNLFRIHSEDDKLFNCKLLLGDCLGAALYRHAPYRQVMQDYLQIAEEHPDDPLILFVIAQAYSKLTDLNTQHIDGSIILRIASQLDLKKNLRNEDKALQLLLGRTIAKIRDTQIGGLLIKTLSNMGSSSRTIAIGAISLTSFDWEPVFYISELENIYKEGLQKKKVTPPGIPSKGLLGLLYDMETDEDPMVQNSLALAKYDLEKAYPILNFPYYASFMLGEKNIITTTYQFNIPFLGILVLATLDNMVELVNKAGPTNIVCLTEPRIVDALFSRAGAFLILEQDKDSLRCQRLRSRKTPFAMLTKDMMSKLKDGDFILVNQDSVTFGRGDVLKRMNKIGFY